MKRINLILCLSTFHFLVVVIALALYCDYRAVPSDVIALAILLGLTWGVSLAILVIGTRPPKP